MAQTLWFGPDEKPAPPDAIRIVGLVNRVGMPCLLDEHEELHILSFKGIAALGGWCRNHPEGEFLPNNFLD